MSGSPPNGSDSQDRVLSPETTPLQPVRSPTDDALSSSFPLAAQIPVQSFTLPTFPPEAAHLRSLTLTSDIKLDDYQNLLQGGQYELPDLPPSITHLTLELFSLGFPGRNPKFLSNLARALPNLKSVTFFSCLIDGLDEAARKDAEDFFDLTRVLKEVHVIDSFVRPGFWKKVGEIWEQRAKEAEILSADNGAAAAEADGGIQVIEVSYTYRGHEDSDFLARVHGEELAKLASIPGIVGAGFGFVEAREDEMPPAKDDDEAEIQKQKEEKEKDSLASGVLPFASDSRASVSVKDHITRNTATASPLRNLKVLNLSLWTLAPEDIATVLSSIQPTETGVGLVDLTLAILLTEDWFTHLTSALSSSSSTIKNLAGLEIVGVPSLSSSSSGKASGPSKTDQQIDNIMHDATSKDNATEWSSSGQDGGNSLKLLDETQAAALGEKCQRLAKVEMSILKARKAGVALWVREGSGQAWKSG